MNTRKLRKVLLTLCSALLLVSLSVGITIAYLTDSESVTNTFSVGQVGLSLDEADVDDTDKDENKSERDKTNAYHLQPGMQYDKDPTVHVDANSEPCWVFVKVENGLSDIEAAATYKDAEGNTATGTIAEQIEKFGWTKLSNNVYYKDHANKQTTVTDYVVFKNFKLVGDGLLNGTKPDGYTGNDKFIGDYVTNADGTGTTINIKAYAIQKAGFEDNVAGAWTEVSKLDSSAQ